MTDAPTASPALAAAYGRLAPGPLPPDDPDGRGVAGMLEPAAGAILQALETAGRLEPVRWTAVGGAGVSTLLGRLAVSEPVAERHYPVPLALAECIHLMDAEPADLEFAAFLALMDAAPDSGIDPPWDTLRDLLGGSTRKGAGAEELRPDHLRRRLRADGRFRAVLREELQTDPDRLSAAIADLAGKFSRNTVGAYRLTGAVFDRLREAEVSGRVLSAVESLKGVGFRSEVRFLRELEKAVGELQALHYKPLFLEHAWGESPRDPLLLVDDIGKLARGAADTLFGKDGIDFSRRGVQVLAGLPPRFAGGEGPVLGPVPLRGRDGKTDPAGAERLREVLARRLDPDIAPPGALSPLIEGSGGLLRDLFALSRKALVRAALAESGRLTPEIAEAAVREAGRLRARFLDRETHGPALDRVEESRSFQRVEPAEAAYLLRYGFVLPVGNALEDSWCAPHPLLSRFSPESGTERKPEPEREAAP
jgi:hypothetical protein